MPIRVTQHMMYHDMVNRMQKNLSAYMESNEQGSTQKKINRPSDDPAGMYRVLTTRNAISSTTQYEENAKTALGWLQQADDILSTQVATTIISLRELAEQAATGTNDAANREQMSFKARELFGTLLNLANTETDSNRHLFGGHIYDRPAFEEGLALTSWDAENGVTDDWKTFNGSTPPRYQIEGASDTTVMIQFTGVNMNTAPGTTGVVGSDNLQYRWSNDGGKTWTDATLAAGNNVLAANGLLVTLPLNGGTGQQISVADPDLGPGATNGTLLYIRPTAVYMGDDNDPPPEVTFMGAPTGLTGSAQGTFHSDVFARVDAVNGTDVTYSYSTDAGSTWITATSDAAGYPPLRLTVPGGYLDINVAPGSLSTLVGTQVKIHPDRADLDFEIMKDTFVTVNNVGKDIFGGYYQGEPALNNNGDLSRNLFEVVGNFIAYLENNNQEGCQRTLPALLEAEKVILTAAAKVGGKENRVQTAQNVLSFQKIDQKEQLSNTEDIDLTELLTKLTQQQMAYSTVLKSSSMIMQLSLVNYV
jgi:flagellar hook-associated protein 3 FlgL